MSKVPVCDSSSTREDMVSRFGSVSAFCAANIFKKTLTIFEQK
jgi:hypothetical protein